jgi:hypothetical protein
MKLSLLTLGESRRGWMKLGNDTISQPSATRRVPESKNNRYDVSSHRHGGVREVGMLRSVIETSREILAVVAVRKMSKTPRMTSYQNREDAGDCKEVGGVHSSDDGFVMKLGAKEPYLVDVNREVKIERTCDGW